MGLSVGVLVLVSTANWQGTQPHSTRFTTAHSIEFDLVFGRGWAGTRKAVFCSDRGVAAVAVAVSIEEMQHWLQSFHWLEMAWY